MKVILERKRSGVYAIGEFDPVSKTMVVKQGATVSSDIHYTEKFRGARTIEEFRNKYVVDGKTVMDVSFRSASTAANFVTGGSTNGLVAWKTEDCKPIREILGK